SFPALVINGASAEHGVVLGLAIALCLGVVEGVTHGNALNRALREAFERLRSFDAAAIENGGNEVDSVVILVARAAGDALHYLRPGDDERIGDAAFEREALKHFVR